MSDIAYQRDELVIRRIAMCFIPGAGGVRLSEKKEPEGSFCGEWGINLELLDNRSRRTRKAISILFIEFTLKTFV